MMDERQTWTAFQWAKAITLEHGKTVESILAIGHLFLAAKKMLPHGEFQHVFVDLPIDRRMAEIYMAIARNPVIGNAKHISHLPIAVSTLYQLCRLPPAVLQGAIAHGRVHPGLQRDEVRALFASTTPAVDETWSLDEREEYWRYQFNDELTEAPAEERDNLLAMWQRLLGEMTQARHPDRQRDIQAARDDLELHDAEPGGYRIFEDETAVAFHPDAAAVIGGLKSTHADWYKTLTTKPDGGTALDREVIERRLDDLDVGRLPTRCTQFSYVAVMMAICGCGRRFGIQRGCEQGFT